MHIHILGICGTFMAGIATLAKQLGHKVTGSDNHAYPPMSTQLEEQGITVFEGYQANHLEPTPDQIIIGNALSRGNEAIEHILNHRLNYCSGPQWLAENILKDKKVIVVSGTHGKTTTSSMLTWVLEQAGLNPSFLIGGVPRNLNVSARLTDSEWFVLEGDEYDSAFFDKRSKFIHYRPHHLIINNLEFDHADIFPDLAAIQKQFHHLIRTVPGQGIIIYPIAEKNIVEVLQQGCWSPTETIGPMGNWQAKPNKADGSDIDIILGDDTLGTLKWDLIGEHNTNNALSTLACAHHIGIEIPKAIKALQTFSPPKKRLEHIATINKINIFDDFAHHPTAIATTLKGLRAHVGKKRIFALLEPRSNTMKMGIHQHELVDALHPADQVWLFQPPNIKWDLQSLARECHMPCTVLDNTDTLVEQIISTIKPGDNILIMSNGDFNNIQQKLIDALSAQ